LGQHSPSQPAQNSSELGSDAVIDFGYDSILYGSLTMTNIVTMNYELAQYVCAQMPTIDNSVNYFPIEREPGKFAIGTFDKNLVLLDYIKSSRTKGPAQKDHFIGTVNTSEVY
tara:strand:- start:625 stop:963 length:339 start_codon:yes stop_codon:yes gene_type:complete